MNDHVSVRCVFVLFCFVRLIGEKRQHGAGNLNTYIRNIITEGTFSAAPFFEMLILVKDSEEEAVLVLYTQQQQQRNEMCM